MTWIKKKIDSMHNEVSESSLAIQMAIYGHIQSVYGRYFSPHVKKSNIEKIILYFNWLIML